MYLDLRKAAADAAGLSAECGSVTSAMTIEARLDAIDWAGVYGDLDAQGWAIASKMLTHSEADSVSSLYHQKHGFRSHVIMSRHGFGRGEYKYFAEPLPDVVAGLRASLYPRLAPIANRWAETMGVTARYPADLSAFRALCRAAGQTRPTPLILRYRAGDYNCLHQDVYGALVFPLQVAIVLSAPGRDFAGGEFVLAESRPRMQSRAEVVSLTQGDGVIFAVRERPVQGTRGPYRVALRHGVSRIRSGERFTPGIIFHDAA